MRDDTLYKKLCEHYENGAYPFHMPGHKRNIPKELFSINPYKIDITEIDGFDDLHHPEGCIKQAQERAAKLYGADETYFLINGCTGGILAAVRACTQTGGRILLARNSHKSVYNAVLINQLRPVYVWPEDKDGLAGEISASEVRKALEENRDISCVFITSPTYEGYVSDIKAISEAAHEYGVPVIVDEAHGAHMKFHGIFPESAVEAGADIVINGIHKTLPSLTQTALLHVQGNLVDRKKLGQSLSIFQSSSPSYVLMAAIDYAMTYICHEGVQLYNHYSERLKILYDKLAGLDNLYVLPYGSGRDASKIVVCTDRAGISGHELYDMLVNAGIMPEMSSLYHVVLMTSAWDNEDAYEGLVKILCDIDAGLAGGASCEKYTYPKAEYVMPMSEAECVKEKCAAESIATEMIYIYPPGIPIVVPGERITEEVRAFINELKDKGYKVMGETVQQEDSIL